MRTVVKPFFNRWLILVSGVFLFCFSLRSADWPHRAGPQQSGYSSFADIPGSWSKTDNVAWASAIPVLGDATPVVLKQHVVTVAYEKSNKALIAVAMLRGSGRQVWRNYIGPSHPVTFADGRLVNALVVADDQYVTFVTMSGVLVTFDLSGKELWRKDWRKDFIAKAGDDIFSPGVTLNEGRLYLPIYSGKSLVSICLEQLTGKQVWQVQKEGAAAVLPGAISSSLLLVSNKQQAQFIVSDGKALLAYDANQGKLTSRLSPAGLAREDVFSIISRSEAGLIVCSPKTQKLICLGLPSLGLKWERDADGVQPDGCSVSGYAGDFIVLNNRSKKLIRMDGQTGKTRWQLQLPENKSFIAQPTGSAGKIFCLSAEGEVFLIGAEEGAVLSVTPMGDALDNNDMSSVALAQGQLFIQTAGNLYCIGKKSIPEGPSGLSGRPAPEVRVGEPEQPKRRLPL